MSEQPEAIPPVIPPSPDLGENGRRIWDSVAEAVRGGVYALRPDDWVILGQAARQADIVAAVEGQIDFTQPLYVPGTGGAVVANPLLRELRGQKQLLAALLKQLGLPDLASGPRSGQHGGAREGSGNPLMGGSAGFQGQAAQKRHGYDWGYTPAQTG